MPSNFAGPKSSGISARRLGGGALTFLQLKTINIFLTKGDCNGVVIRINQWIRCKFSSGFFSGRSSGETTSCNVGRGSRSVVSDSPLPFKKISDLRWLVRSSATLALVLPLAFVLGPQEAAAQTITLNTGWVGQTATGPTIGLFQPDDDWRITADLITPAPLPRPAIVVGNVTTTHIKWPVPFANSQWISPSANKYMGSLQPPRTPFTYQMCFNLPASFSAPKLNVQFRADDIVRRVSLNGGAPIFIDNNPAAIAVAGKPGSHLGPPLLVQATTGFQSGQNCLDVVVEDTQQLITGLNAAGTVTYCVVNQQDLSTGVAPWKVNAAPAHATAPYPGWATKDPNGVPLAAFPTGTQWIQPANSTTAQNAPGGPYTYVLKFTLPQCAGATKVHGWFAADNGASMKIDNNAVVNCSGPPNLCFQQGSMTSFSQMVVGPGPHTITFNVTNAGTAANMSPTGLLAHITVP
jgi:hypothetical protein